MKDDKLSSLRLPLDPWDVPAWEALASKAIASGNLEQQREAYEQIVTRFPFAASYWQRYAELEVDESDASRAKIVFSRCLLDCPLVKLWSLYLRFIKKMNEAKGTAGLPDLRKSFEYTLERVGADALAGPLWLEYLSLLHSPRVGTAAFQALFGGGLPGQEETQRTLLLRRAYHRALTVPGKHLDQIWRMYEDFERRGSNTQLAKREIDEQRPRWQAAKQAAVERARLQAALTVYSLALPPGAGGWQQQRQAELWKEYIAWEKSNPQRLDSAALSQRVHLAYEQALMPLMHYPEVWLSFSQWHRSEAGSGAAAAAAVLRRATKVLPECSLLSLAAAELHESRGETEEARGMFEALVEALPPEPSTSGAGEGEPAAGTLSQSAREAGTLVWIHYMRFSRRTEGVQASRKVFLRARRWHGCSWQAFVAAALMEYAGDGNDRVARNIFELGLEQFLAAPGYVLQYADFLLGLADLHNARALFERALGETPAAESKPLWDRYIQMQSMYGDLTSVSQLIQRRREVLGESDVDDIAATVLTQRFLDIWPCSSLEKTHLQRLFGELPPTASGPTAQQQPTPSPSVIAGSGDAVNSIQQPQSQQAGSAPSGPSTKPEPIKQMPAELGSFLAALPPPRGQDPPFASVDAVIDLLVRADLSPEALAATENVALRPGLRPVATSLPLQALPAGIKRERDEPEAGEILENGPGMDAYRARAKQRIKRGA